MLKKIMKVLTFVVVTFVTVLALLYVEENIRGKAAWDSHLRELEAKGDTLDILKIAPPPVPDMQNMAAAPIFAELMTASNQNQTRLGAALKQVLPEPMHLADWRLGQRMDLARLRVALSNENLLTALQPAEGVLREIEEAAARPHYRFPIQYEKGFACLLPHVNALRSVERTLELRALAKLNTGHAEAAFQDVRLMLRLAYAMRDEPLLISVLVRLACTSLAQQVVWEGLAEHRWSEKQLRQLQEDLSKINLLPHLEAAFHAERCMAKWTLDLLIADPRLLSQLTGGEAAPFSVSILPSGWLYFNCLNVELFYQQYILPCVDSRLGRIYPDLAAASDEAMAKHSPWKRMPYHVLEALLLPAVTSVILKTGSAQSSAQCAMLACAVERYRLANGRLPDSLEALVPHFIAVVPRDVMDGQPLRYRLDGPDGFVVYSIGWNKSDDGGQQNLTKEGKPRLEEKQGDWVWRSNPTSLQGSK